MEKPSSPRFHHVGIVVKKLESFIAAGGYELVGEIVTDPVQKARLCLIRQFGEAEAHVELVEPVGSDSPLAGALDRGGGLHHLCYEVATRSEADAFLAQRRFLPVTPWQPAVLFGGRSVRFAFTRNRELIEFLAHESSP